MLSQKWIAMCLITKWSYKRVFKAKWFFGIIMNFFIMSSKGFSSLLSLDAVLFLSYLDKGCTVIFVKTHFCLAILLRIRKYIGLWNLIDYVQISQCNCSNLKVLSIFCQSLVKWLMLMKWKCCTAVNEPYTRYHLSREVSNLLLCKVGNYYLNSLLQNILEHTVSLIWYSQVNICLSSNDNFA